MLRGKGCIYHSVLFEVSIIYKRISWSSPLTELWFTLQLWTVRTDSFGVKLDWKMPSGSTPNALQPLLGIQATGQATARSKQNMYRVDKDLQLQPVCSRDQFLLRCTAF